MTTTIEERRARFRELHQSGCFVMPNPWDIGSARMLESLGFQAVASTSAGFAWSTGRPDYNLPRDEVLVHLQSLANSVSLPLNADFESGFASTPEGIGESVGLAIAAGVAGLSIEDRDVERGGLYEPAMAIERFRAARAAVDQSGEDVVLVARTELLLVDGTAINPAIDRLVAFSDAGADCLYAPGAHSRADIEALVKAVAPKPLNVVMMRPGLSFAELADLGVRRISIGGAFARVMWASAIQAARLLKEGRFDVLGTGVPGAELDTMFRSFTDA